MTILINFHKKSPPRGFTLLEMSMVIVVLGLIAGAIFSGYGSYLKQKNIELTNTDIETITAKIIDFRKKTGRYPCPASLSKNRNTDASSKDYGREICYGDAVYTEVVAPGNCATGNDYCVQKSIRADLAGVSALPTPQPSNAADCTGLGSAHVNDSVSGRCFYKSSSSADWSSAQAACQSGGGYLATPQSASESNMIFSIAGSSYPFLGGSDSAVEGEWRWGSGGASANLQFWQGGSSGSGGHALNGSYTKWNGGEPNDSGGTQDCLAMEPNGNWDDLSCGTNQAYICEKDPVGPNAPAALPAQSGQRILIGAVPFRDLNINESQSYDPYGSRLFYVVTQSLTSYLSFNQANGGIQVADQAGNDLTQPPGSAHLVVFSAGPDGMGGYNRNGLLFSPCAGGMDAEDCDFETGALDAKFTSMAKSDVAGAAHYDDVLKFNVAEPRSLWRRGQASNPGENENDIMETANDNVALGVLGVKPTAEMHVMYDPHDGDIDGNVALYADLNLPNAANYPPQAKLKSDQFCNNDGSECFGVSGLVRTCPAGEYVVGISDGTIQCSKIYYGCYNNEYLAGKNADGSAKCITIPAPPPPCPTCGNGGSNNPSTTGLTGPGSTTGTPGIPGTPGTPGTPGDNNNPGPPGPGNPGSSGTPGTDGTAGSSGAPGTTGADSGNPNDGQTSCGQSRLQESEACPGNPPPPGYTMYTKTTYKDLCTGRVYVDDPRDEKCCAPETQGPLDTACPSPPYLNNGARGTMTRTKAWNGSSCAYGGWSYDYSNCTCSNSTVTDQPGPSSCPSGQRIASNGCALYSRTYSGSDCSLGSNVKTQDEVCEPIPYSWGLNSGRLATISREGNLPSRGADCTSTPNAERNCVVQNGGNYDVYHCKCNPIPGTSCPGF